MSDTLHRFFSWVGKRDQPPQRNRPNDFYHNAHEGLARESDEGIQRVLDQTGYSQRPKPWSFSKPVTVEEVRRAKWQELPFPNAFSNRDKGGEGYDDWQVFEASIPGYDGSAEVAALPEDVKLTVVRREHPRTTRAAMEKPPIINFILHADIEAPAVNRSFLCFAYNPTLGHKILVKVYPAAKLLSASPLTNCEFADGQIISKEQALKAGFRVALIKEK
ncbi:MAG: hypothetical protein HYV42_02840 [Candidatus Magasanikbacteria bacterium]|nr:hypothetical protein [Candidatus Magasanikbacteria bacterium]